jgi:uncharacterized integral membrane protein (TIGR00698 family)
MRTVMQRWLGPTLWQPHMQRLGSLVPGLTLCILIAFAASHAAGQHGGPAMLYALLFGTALHYLSEEVRTAPGVLACASTVLRLGVGLLGARITLSQIVGLGWSSLLLVFGGVLTTMLCGVVLARRFGLSRSLGILAGGATAICGASAALAISAVLPRSEVLERDTLAVVVLATLLSTLAMLAYPLIAGALHLPAALSGLFIGGSIHDVAQVVVAGYAMGPNVGDAASIVKLFRVSMLPLVVLVISWLVIRAAQRASVLGQAGAASRRAIPKVPGFLLLFLCLAAANTAGWIPSAVQAGLNDGSSSCLGVGVAALGMKTSFSHLARSGWRQAALMTVTTIWLGTFMLIGLLLMRGEAWGPVVFSAATVGR